MEMYVPKTSGQGGMRSSSSITTRGRDRACVRGSIADVAWGDRPRGSPPDGLVDLLDHRSMVDLGSRVNDPFPVLGPSPVHLVAIFFGTSGASTRLPSRLVLAKRPKLQPIEHRFHTSPHNFTSPQANCGPRRAEAAPAAEAPEGAMIGRRGFRLLSEAISGSLPKDPWTLL